MTCLSLVTYFESVGSMWIKGKKSIGGILEQAASFVQTARLRQYHPISFIAKGAARDFLLEPLYSLRDEFYTAYFNIGA
jgi:uncharacterized protein